MVLKKNGLPPDSSYTTIDYISRKKSQDYIILKAFDFTDEETVQHYAL
jgi:hypothetical protein